MKDMRKLFTAVISVMIFTACSEASEIDPDSYAVTTTTVQTTVSEQTVIRPPERVRSFTARIISYSDGQLTYELDGKTESIPLRPEGFLNDQGRSYLGDKISQKIINNPYGCEVKGKIKIDPDSAKNTCDVFTPNLSSFSGSDFYYSAHPDGSCSLEDGMVTMKRLGGSKVEFSNQYGSAQADLNDLDTMDKSDYPMQAEKVQFRAYQLPDGHLILDSLTFFDSYDEKGGIHASGISNRDHLRFFGTVQSLTEDRAEVLLTDGKTLCDVPTYYNDGEIKEGMDVMLTLDADISLYGSGKPYKADYAVFTTHPEAFVEGYRKEDHAKYAYALRDEHNSVVYHGVMREEALTQ